MSPIPGAKLYVGDDTNNVASAHKTGLFRRWQSWNMYGLEGNDVLTGSPLDDMLNGGEGIDRLVGRGGDDNYYVDNSFDTVIENANEGYDTVRSTATFQLGQNVEELILQGGSAINGTGNNLSNILRGNNNHNVLRGYSGNDVMYGNGGNDTLDGGFGADKMYGGLGNDTFVVDNVNDRVYETYNQGTDTVQSSLYLYELGNYVENLKLIGNARQGIGNSRSNVITGNYFDNQLSGGWGEDTLNGGYGDDALFGGEHDDVLIGGYGNDRLVGFSGTRHEFNPSEYDVLTGGGNADTFVLGDSAHGVFYLGGVEDDYALITDFNRVDGDKFEIIGQASDYTLDKSENLLGSAARDTQILYQGDLIAVVSDTSSVWMADFTVAQPPVIT